MFIELTEISFDGKGRKSHGEKVLLNKNIIEKVFERDGICFLTLRYGSIAVEESYESLFRMLIS